MRWELEPTGDDAAILSFINETPAPDDAVGKTRSGWHVHLDFVQEFLDDGTHVDWANWPRDRWAQINDHYNQQEAAWA